ncbi:MAG: hypothetical protein V8R64_13470 [Thomasclavelia sp.]
MIEKLSMLINQYKKSQSISNSSKTVLLIGTTKSNNSNRIIPILVPY